MFIFKTVLLIKQISRRLLSRVNWPKKTDIEVNFSVIAPIVDTRFWIFSQEIQFSVKVMHFPSYLADMGIVI